MFSAVGKSALLGIALQNLRDRWPPLSTCFLPQPATSESTRSSDWGWSVIRQVFLIIRRFRLLTSMPGHDRVAP